MVVLVFKSICESTSVSSPLHSRGRGVKEEQENLLKSQVIYIKNLACNGYFQKDVIVSGVKENWFLKQG